MTLRSTLSGMDLRAICTACSQEFSLSQATAPGPLQGLCPWCGTTLAPQKTSRLVEKTTRINEGMENLVAALQLLAKLPRRFRLVTPDFSMALPDEVDRMVESTSLE